ncbi:MerR family transcriptional regulator [Streptomyces sp. NK08204]|uniref:MerR family transcriptional regulator n=1 Tax=Streptomyces sp. NK08204 TaxID=2873260 RepID=UPI0027E3896E|nr:MerR family transcriptional regulator [Streptomyces sp. NK08204]
MTPVRPDRSVERTYRIGDLAHGADATARTIRAHQDRGLLPSRGAWSAGGRGNLSSEVHATRLREIDHLLARGHNLASHKEFLEPSTEGATWAGSSGWPRRGETLDGRGSGPGASLRFLNGRFPSSTYGLPTFCCPDCCRCGAVEEPGRANNLSFAVVHHLARLRLLYERTGPPHGRQRDDGRLARTTHATARAAARGRRTYLSQRGVRSAAPAPVANTQNRENPG